jgi:peptide/nickel transport system substrate-binding protein
LTRRGFLGVAGGAAGAILLGACSEGVQQSGGSSGTSGSAAPTPTNGSTDPSSAAPTGPSLSPGPATDGAPRRGGRLRVGVIGAGPAETLDPAKASAWPDWPRTHALYDGLFQTVPHGVAPYLAESAEPNADATKWVIKLRKGVTWHNGKPFTADDVLYTVSLWGGGKHNFGATAASLIDLKKVRKIDDHTVEFPMLFGIAEFPSITANFNAFIVQDGWTTGRTPVGTGPFKYESFTPGSSSTFTANKDYWQEGKPYVDELVFDSSFRDDAARLNALKSGVIDIATDLSYDIAATLQPGSGVVLGNAQGMSFQSFVMQVDKAPFDDVRVRQALRYIVDRPAMVQHTLDGFGSVGNDLVGKTLPYFANDLTRSQDLAKAKALLAEAGKSDLNITVATTPAQAGFVAAATLFAQQAKGAGVTVTVKNIDPGQWYSVRGQQPMAMASWSGTPSLSFFYSTALATGAPFNMSHWSSPDGDKALRAALSETDPAKAEAKWRTVQEEQFNSGGYIVYANRNYVDAYSPKVRGVQTDSTGSTNDYTYSSAWLTA